jgi:hypothetical protein
MEQHPIPRQITTFEFKLIGFMTLKQFLYLVVFIPLGYIVIKLFPIPFVNILLGFVVAGIGAALAFLPVQDKPLDQWIKNLWKRLNAPTQYTYLKHNPPLFLIQDLYFVTDPHKVMAHIESKEKLASYLATTNQQQKPNVQKQEMQNLLRKPSGQLAVKKPGVSVAPQAPQQYRSPVQPPALAGSASQPPMRMQPQAQPTAQVQQISTAAPSAPRVDPQHPSLIGIIKNNKKIPLPGILIYIKNSAGQPVRLLKTNPHGIFASYNPLPAGTYTVEVKDPKQGYFFDTMTINVTGGDPLNLQIHSREML